MDVKKFGLSKGEYLSVKKAVGGMEPLIDEKSEEYEKQFIKHLARQEDAEARLLVNPGMYKTPIVRNGREATVGYRPETWDKWS